MTRREFLMLAHNFVPDKHGVGQWLMSEKLDGMRAFWDGGLTRGMPASTVPFANTEKDARYKEPPIATGLWSRYGNVINAPTWWLDLLPKFPLDGELWAGNNSWQSMSSIVKKINPNAEDWKQIRYLVFDSPSWKLIFEAGEIKTTNYKKIIPDLSAWVSARRLDLKIEECPYTFFEHVYSWLLANIPESKNLAVHQQEQLHWKTEEALKEINIALERVTNAGGEGLMIRQPLSVWNPRRSHYLLKIKKLSDAEGTVIGYTWGRETDLGSKLLGKMGALLLRLPSGKEFELSGFTDEERMMLVISDGTLNWMDMHDHAYNIGCIHPGERVQDNIENPKFPRGTTVTFKYRELSDAGIPKEARYWRKAN